jgi:hypothetical protein
LIAFISGGLNRGCRDGRLVQEIGEGGDQLSEGKGLATLVGVLKMQDEARLQRPRSETDAKLTDRNRGWAERVVLGSNPSGSMVRVVLFVVLFVVFFGTIFYLAQR